MLLVSMSDLRPCRTCFDLKSLHRCRVQTMFASLLSLSPPHALCMLLGKAGRAQCLIPHILLHLPTQGAGLTQARHHPVFALPEVQGVPSSHGGGGVTCVHNSSPKMCSPIGKD